MALFVVEQDAPLTVAEAWRRVTDWPRHGDLVPFTRVTVTTPAPTGEGTVFVARTGAGPLGFDDPMEVVVWRPPNGAEAGFCRLVKRGSFVTGWAEIEVGPTRGGAHVVWREDAAVRPLPRALDPLLRAGAGVMFGQVLKRLLRAPSDRS
ncbi:SRPBCC family protein [Streptomyces minutiscleroticus]|uniref:SRPBCC family protein n=1 Tax=Streptomyces minutiscleroticus TaxID=68238 RepID=UPI00167D61BF|nr:SRPBCC family protein [Streptomyces minutiscleroticus]